MENWSCNQGHQWENDHPVDPSSCPVCGDSSIYPISPTVHMDGDSTQSEKINQTNADATVAFEQKKTQHQDQTLNFDPADQENEPSLDQTANLEDSGQQSPANISNDKTEQIPKQSSEIQEVPQGNTSILQQESELNQTGEWKSEVLDSTVDVTAKNEETDRGSFWSDTANLNNASQDQITNSSTFIPSDKLANLEDKTQDMTVDQSSPEGASAKGEDTDQLNLMAQSDDSLAEKPTQRREGRIPSPREQRAGTKPVVAGYEILGVLGRGGMGVVYKARQLGLNRMAALKMVLSGAHASTKDLARFRIEAEAVADLQHPNIVQIYEVGEHNDLPFFSLEFVEGGTLQDKMDGTPMKFEEAAQLIEILARAVFCAHQKGIIHRDLKPANILLTPEGQPKITDFGLAKRIDEDAGQTGTGDILGTPTYMAPEQAEGRIKEIGTGTDVYALGAILYDLLTGQPPFKGSTIMDTLHQVLNDQPVPPSRLQPKLPRDLNVICLKCLEKDPAKRYSTAEALADDLRAFLNNEPIQARPATIWERSIKWVRRHPAGAALVGVCCLGIISLTFGGYVWANRESDLRHEAELRKQEAVDQKKEAETQRSIAVKNYYMAREAVDEMLTRVAETRLAREPRMTRLRRDLLQKALKFYQDFLQDMGDDESVQWETAQAYRRVGHIQELLGDYKESQEAYNSAIGLLKKLAAKNADTKYQLALGTSYQGLGTVLQATGQLSLARDKYATSVYTLSALKQDNRPRDKEIPLELGKAYNNLGTLLLNFDKNEAKKAFHQAITLLEKNAVQQRSKLQLSRACTNLATLVADSNTDEAIGWYETAMNAQKQLVADAPEVSEYWEELGRTFLNLGELWHQHKKAYQKAGNYYKDAQKLFVDLTDHYPDVIDYRNLLALTYNNQALLFRAKKQFDEVQEYRKKAQEQWAKLVVKAPDYPNYKLNLARCLQEEAFYYHGRKELPKSIASLRQAVKLLQEISDQFSAKVEYQMELIRSLHDLGKIYAAANNAPLAEKNYRSAIKNLEQLGKKQTKLPQAWEDLSITTNVNLGLLQVYTKRTKESEPQWRKVIHFQEKQVQRHPEMPKAHTNLASTSSFLAGLLKQHGKIRESEEFLEKAVNHQLQAVDLIDSPKNKEDLRKYVVNLLQTQLALKNPAELYVAAKKAETKIFESAESYVKIAGILCLSAEQVQNDAGLTKEKKADLLPKYEGLAIAYLQRALKSGFKDADHLKTAGDFSLLRDNPEFQKVLQSMNKKQ